MARSKIMVTKPNIHRAVKEALSARVEHKRLTNVGAYSNLATAGVVNSITQAIAQGDDIGNRSGDAILLESIRLRVVFADLDPVSSSPSRYVGRVILFSDTQAINTAPAVTDVLASADVLSGIQVAFRQQHRFKVYLDELVGVNNISSRMYQIIDRTFKINKKVFYTAASGSSSNGRNSFYALFITDTAVATVHQYKWSYELQYTDS